MTNPDGPVDAEAAALLGQARTMIEAAALLITAAEGRLAAPLPTPFDDEARAEADRDARAAVATHELARQLGATAQSAMYTAVRRLKRAGASRPEIHTVTGLTGSLIKWIVEHHAERRARRRQAADDE